jgi:hypothetical protein
MRAFCENSNPYRPTRPSTIEEIRAGLLACPRLPENRNFYFGREPPLFECDDAEDDEPEFDDEVEFEEKELEPEEIEPDDPEPECVLELVDVPELPPELEEGNPELWSE